MKRHQLRIVRVFALIAIALASLGMAATSAQDVPTEIDFTIASFTCTSDPGQVSMAAGNIPDTCTPDVGAVASVALQDGTAVGSCTTDASGICKLQAPNEATVVVTLDAATLASGATPRENPVTTQVVTEFAGAIFINLPAAPAPTAVPAELPDTGVGTAARSQAWLVVASGLVLSLAGAGMVARVRATSVNRK